MQTSRSAGQTETPFRFLHLPREIRDQIYEHVLVCETLPVRAIGVPADGKFLLRSTFRLWETQKTYRLGGDVCQRPNLSILKVCRQVRFEGAAVFYSKNVFFFDYNYRTDFLSPIIQTALAFFNDRPALALENVKSVGFKVGNWNGSWDGHTAFHGHAKRHEVLDFMSLFRDRLPALNHVSILFRGWPPKHGVVNPWSPGLTENAGSESDSADIYIPTMLNILLHLPRVKRFSMELWADIEEQDPTHLIAFTALIRSRLLLSAPSLGTSNITLHKRHHTESVRTSPDTDHSIRRRPTRLFIVRCDDTADGRSLLTPARRPSPLFAAPPGWDGAFAEDPKSLYDIDEFWLGVRRLDYAKSDGGDDDSLNELDLSGLDLGSAKPDFFNLASLE